MPRPIEVLCTHLDATQKTASGLFLPSAGNAQPPPEALVLAVGPGAPNRDGVVVPVSVKAGDKVVIPGFGGVGVKVGDEVPRLSLSRAGSGSELIASLCGRRSTRSTATRRSSPSSPSKCKADVLNRIEDLSPLPCFGHSVSGDCCRRLRVSSNLAARASRARSPPMDLGRLRSATGSSPPIEGGKAGPNGQRGPRNLTSKAYRCLDASSHIHGFTPAHTSPPPSPD